MHMSKFYKWTHCFVVWKDVNNKCMLSIIPWRVLFYGIIGITDFEWHWVPPWKIDDNIMKKD